MQTVYLTRRNLLILLSKLDRNKLQPESSQCTIIKRDTVHPEFPCSDVIWIKAVEDDVYYKDRPEGIVHPADDPRISRII
jgi:hypothetical protein